jgi:hypothetical protein
MATEGIDHFNECAAFVLATLYDSFPVPKPIYTNELQDPTDPGRTLRVSRDHPQGMVDEDPAVAKALDSYRWTVHFLIHEGFIRDIEREQAETAARFQLKVPPPLPRNAMFKELTLTMKGLVALNSIPTSLQGKPVSFIERLRNGIAADSREIIKDTIGALLAQTVTGVFTAMGPS